MWPKFAPPVDLEFFAKNLVHLSGYFSFKITYGGWSTAQTNVQNPLVPRGTFLAASCVHLILYLAILDTSFTDQTFL